MASDVSRDLTSTIISLQKTIQKVKQNIQNDQQKLFFDPTQPIGHLLDNTSSSAILGLASPTSDMTAELGRLEQKLADLQEMLVSRSQWQPTSAPVDIPCSTDFLDLSDLSTAVGLVGDVVKYSDPSTQITPQEAFSKKKWTWDPLWREFFSNDPATQTARPTATYLSRWIFDPQRELWHHANMAGSGLLPYEAQERLGSWQDWRWDAGSGEWGLDVSHELHEEQRQDGVKMWVFASRWQERDGLWVYVGERGG